MCLETVQRRALQHTEPHQKGSFPKKMRITTKTGAPPVVKYLNMFSSAEVCDQRKMMLLQLLTALRSERAIAHRIEKAPGLPTSVPVPGKQGEGSSTAPPRPGGGLQPLTWEAWFSFSSVLLLKEINSHL